MRTNLLLIALLAGVFCNRLCDAVPSDIRIDPFPFYDIIVDGENIGIDLQSLVYIIAYHFTIIGFWVFGLHMIPRMRGLFILFLWLEVGSFVDLWLFYEHPFIRTNIFSIEFTDIKLLFYALFTVLWRYGKL